MTIDGTAAPTATPRSPATRDLGMRAKLLFPTREIAQQYYLPLIYTACRTCYSELLPDDIFERATTGQVAPDKQQDLIRRVIESGHGSTIEHIVFTFAISGVTRTLSHQLVRHRIASFSQQSQRYVSHKEEFTSIMPDTIAEHPEARRRDWRVRHLHGCAWIEGRGNDSRQPAQHAGTSGRMDHVGGESAHFLILEAGPVFHAKKGPRFWKFPPCEPPGFAGGLIVRSAALGANSATNRGDGQSILNPIRPVQRPERRTLSRDFSPGK